VAERKTSGASPYGPSPWPLDRQRFTERFRTHIPSTKQALNKAVHSVMQMAERCDCVDDNQADLEIALREALANAMIHGNAYRTTKRIFIRCYGAPSSALLIVVRDEGEGFDPTNVPDPRDEDRMHLHHGRGLLLMRELMDYVEYRKNGREVVLYSYRAAAD
jgi:serine/threonine-protein kinase RsbW